MENHQFKRFGGEGKCLFCDELWPSMDGVVSKLQVCEKCGICVHTSCKSIASQCLPCGIETFSPRSVKDALVKGILTVKLCQAYDLGPTSGALLYGVWRYTTNPLARTENAVAGNNECVWSEQDQQSVSLNLTTDPSVTLKLELWNSYYEIFDKKLFKCSINIKPILLHPHQRLERWFPLKNVHGAQLNGVAKILVQLQFIPDIAPVQLVSPKSAVTSPVMEKEEPIVYEAEPEVVLDEPKSRTFSNLSETVEAALLDMEDGDDDNDADDDQVENQLNISRIDALLDNHKRDDSEEEGEILAALQKVETSTMVSSSESSLLMEEDGEDTVHSEHKLPCKDALVAPPSPLQQQQQPNSAVASPECMKKAEVVPTPAVKLQVSQTVPEKEAKKGAVKKPSVAAVWYENTLNGLSNILSGFDNSISKHIDSSKSIDGISNFESLDKNYVGLLHLTITGASYLKEMAVECDHFVLITIDGRTETFKTPIVYNSTNPKFQAKFSLAVPYFRANITLTLIDAKSKRKIGSAKFFPYEVIVRESDYRVDHKLPKPFTTLTFKDKNNKEDIGFFSLDVSFEENSHDHFWSPNVTWIPSGPEEDLSVERLSIHIARFTAMIDFFNSMFQEYLNIMEWKDPIFTSIIFILFLYSTLYVKPDYTLSGLFFAMVFIMTRTLYRRKYGIFKQMYVSRGRRDISLEYRPIAKLRISAVAFRMAKTSAVSFGSQAENKNPIVKVTYTPVLENTGENSSSSDRRTYLIGCLGGTDQSNGEQQRDGVSQLMSTFVKSETHRKDWLLHNVMDPWPLEPSSPVFREKDVVLARHKEISLLYPILQPVASKVVATRTAGSKSVSIKEEGNNTFENDMSDHSSAHSTAVPDSSSQAAKLASTGIFLPWTQNQSEIQITLIPETSNFLDDEEEERLTLSMVDIMNCAAPVDKNATKFEMLKWFSTSKLHSDSPKDRHIMLTDLDNFVYDGPDPDTSSHFLGTSFDTAQHRLSRRKGTEILLRISFEVPDKRKTFAPTEEEKRTSFILQESLSNRTEKESSTLAVLWNMRDHVKYVQNVMSRILNYMESLKNLFNWTNPARTWPIYLCLFTMWILTVFIPGRILILLFGLYQFLYIILPIPDGNEIVIRSINYFMSIPNDDDMEQIYAAERKLYNEAQQKDKKVQAQKTLLNLSLSVLWSASVKVKASRGNVSVQSSTTDNEWNPAFLVVQGKRLLWWSSEMDCDSSKAPIGQVILTGLSGITQVSPVDQRLFDKPQLLSAVFGQDPAGRPMKLSIAIESTAVKEDFEKTVMQVISS